MSRTISLEQFQAELKAQNAPSRAYLVFRCPLCEALQCGQDLIDAGAGATFEEVETKTGFSCVGRWTGAGTPRNKPDGQPCNWTLGGLFRLNKLNVETPEGSHPFFEVANPEEAAAYLQDRHPDAMMEARK